MSQISLNLIAIGVFTLTLISLIGPLIHLSPNFPAAITGLILGFGVLDTFAWNNQGSNLIQDLFASTKQKQRIIHHEAGHFLIAHHLGIPVKDYTLNSWDAWRRGYLGRGGVIFDLEKLNPQQINLDHFCLVWLGGIAAEKLIYGQATGGYSDRQNVINALTLAGIPPSQQQLRINLALIRAQELIKQKQQSYQILVEALSKGLPVAQCYQLIAPFDSQEDKSIDSPLEKEV